ncbi:MAG: elongation factor P [Planctomycetota bacterium]|jgi:elongation factor P
MVQAKELARGMVVEINGAPCLIERVSVQTPSARGANTLYKVRARNLQTRGKVDKSFKGTDTLGEPEFQRRPAQFLYRNKSGFCFMDMNDYDQFTLQEDDLTEEHRWLDEGMEGISALVVDGRIIGIQVPDTVDLPIVDCSPGVRGDSATGRTKPAALPSGATVQVPEYLNPGDVIRVDTRTGKYVSRAGGG